MSYKIAGIDVHKKVLMVVVIDATTPEEKPERRRFATLPSDLQRLLIWLREQGVEEAVMNPRRNTGDRSGWNWNPTCVCTWPRRFPTVLRGDVSMTSKTRNDWYGG